MADYRNSTRQGKVYFIGIGGIGMSALARWFGAQNWAISGSDVAASRMTKELQKEGVEVNFRHKKGGVRADLALVIRSLAVKADNPELREASRLGIPIFTYPEAVGMLAENHKTIAVAGAHGKSTTTALISLILKKAGLDPTVIVGTNLKEFGNRNFRMGRSPSTLLRASPSYLVLEADEFGKAFLHYSPTIAVVTNIDKEHLDTYKNLNGVKKAFSEFLARTKNGGVLILNKDSKPLYSLKIKIKKLALQKHLGVIWYSIAPRAATNCATTHIIPQLWYNMSNSNIRKTGAGAEIIRGLKKVLKIPGRHNISNALAAYAAGRVLGIPKNKILSAISAYRGAWRRFEYRGMLHAPCFMLRVYDDYAHHPTEIKATLQAFREKFPKSKIICIFQPHQAERLRLLFNEFTTAFKNADVLVLLPIYKVTGRDRMDSRFTSQTLAAAIQKKYPAKQVFYLANPRKLKKFFEFYLRRSASHQRTSAVLVMMGAGDIVNYTDSLLK
jgi:UDP-N-acetylmuramate--alanine ligase